MPAHQLEFFIFPSFHHRYDEKLFIDWPFPSCHFSGYTTLHDRNDNSTPPSGTTQMSYLQMNPLRNGSNATSGTAGNPSSIYPMLKEENSSSSGNNSTNNYPSLSDLSVSLKSFNLKLLTNSLRKLELRHYTSSTDLERLRWSTARLPVAPAVVTLPGEFARVLRRLERIQVHAADALQELRQQRRLLKGSPLRKWIRW